MVFVFCRRLDRGQQIENNNSSSVRETESPFFTHQRFGVLSGCRHKRADAGGGLLLNGVPPLRRLTLVWLGGGRDRQEIRGSSRGKGKKRGSVLKMTRYHDSNPLLWALLVIPFFPTADSGDVSIKEGDMLELLRVGSSYRFIRGGKQTCR